MTSHVGSQALTCQGSGQIQNVMSGVKWHTQEYQILLQIQKLTECTECTPVQLQLT